LSRLSIEKAAEWQPFLLPAKPEQEVPYNLRHCLPVAIAITFSSA
jgi:hypothetical protein